MRFIHKTKKNILELHPRTLPLSTSTPTSTPLHPSSFSHPHHSPQKMRREIYIYIYIHTYIYIYIQIAGNVPARLHFFPVATSRSDTVWDQKGRDRRVHDISNFFFFLFFALCETKKDVIDACMTWARCKRDQSFQQKRPIKLGKEIYTNRTW
jgi:hypothetical protein